jgi:Cu-Zn family superoxide dismutase
MPARPAFLRRAVPCLATVGLAVLAACSAPPGATGAQGMARLEARSGSSASGTVRFMQQGDQVRVVASVSGLKPNQEHGFHVHEKGDCSSPDGMSTGGHFNPGGHPHGPQDKAHHAGDMPSLKADATGRAEATFVLGAVSVTGPEGLIGRGVIVHANPDDYTTQPTGNAGGRIACGVIVAG